MRILGISSDFHDSSAALVVNGAPVFSAAEERFSYQKHDSSFPSLSINAALRHGGISARELDWVAYHEDPVVKFSRVLSSRVHTFPKGFLSFARSVRELMLGQLWVKFDIFQKCGVNPGRIQCVPHHLSHAAYAFATSGMGSAAVLVVDAVGEWSSTTWFHAKREGGAVSLRPLGVVPYPHSLGMLYSAFTGFLGFQVNEGECSVMALAAFGKPVLADRVRQIIRLQADGTYELDPTFFDFSDPSRLPLSGKFLALFGKPRPFREDLPFSCRMTTAELAAVPREQQQYADIAASVQLVLEEAVLALCARLKKETGEENLCLAGGVALNSTMNGRILREAGFARVHIPPDPGDGGGALGAALYLGSRLPAGNSAGAKFSPYLGTSYAEADTLALLDAIDLREVGAHRSIPGSLSRLRGFDVEKPPDFSALASSVCADLAAGKVVGWVQGRFESGPRALGNRSLLADPRSPGAAARLSRNIKQRAAFRPYALSVSEESAGRLFGVGGMAGGMRWMQSTHPVLEAARPLVSHALHVDGTTRPQLVGREENPRFHCLLSAWEKASGVPALLNTSFNAAGYPLVSSPVDALLMFVRTDVETLVLNDAIVRKKF